MLAGAFLVLAFVQISSHAFTDSRDPAHFETLGFCGIQHDNLPAIDGPTKQKQRAPESNLLDEMTHHAVLLNDLTLPSSHISYWTDESTESVVRFLFGSPTIPFHPPKRA